VTSAVWLPVPCCYWLWNVIILIEWIRISFNMKAVTLQVYNSLQVSMFVTFYPICCMSVLPETKLKILINHNTNCRLI
jgi:hypothetical protein